MANLGLSRLACTVPSCGIKHILGEFEIDSWVLVQNSNSPFFAWKGRVISWSQHGCPISYRIAFGENLVTFDPCELKAYPAPKKPG